MQKIDFINNSLPALNATNLNRLQQNIADSLEIFENDFETHNSISNVDANDYKSNGVYYLGTGCQNVPSTWIKLIVCGGTDITQIAIKVNAAVPLMYIRAYDGRDWSTWQMVNSIVEEGSNSNGNYIKYADGTIIQWGMTYSGTTAFTTSYGNCYYDGISHTITFPQSFIDSNEAISMTPNLRGEMGGCTITSQNESAVSMFVYSLRSYTFSREPYISWTAIGKWK